MGAQCCAQQNGQEPPSTIEVESAVKGPEDDGPVVDLLFLLPGGGTEPVQAKYRPLGAGFVEETPLAVEKIKPNSVAEDLKIRPGWKLKEVNGSNVFNLPVDESFSVLQKAFSVLPTKQG
mmetsp:Transcript_47693/g.108195  ORF Transcript_47693/g.108195 Transcript_47693/m.108195 type:complete len:120 (-) Transcript_47693:89-448(-)